MSFIDDLEVIVDVDLTVLGNCLREGFLKEISFVGLAEALEHEVKLLFQGTEVGHVVLNLNILGLKERVGSLVGVFRELVEEALTSDSQGNFLICSIRVECDLTSQLNTDDTTTEDKDVLGFGNLFVELLHGSLALSHRVGIVVLDGVVV